MLFADEKTELSRIGRRLGPRHQPVRRNPQPI